MGPTKRVRTASAARPRSAARSCHTRSTGRSRSAITSPVRMPVGELVRRPQVHDADQPLPGPHERGEPRLVVARHRARPGEGEEDERAKEPEDRVREDRRHHGLAIRRIRRNPAAASARYGAPRATPDAGTSWPRMSRLRRRVRALRRAGRPPAARRRGAQRIVDGAIELPVERRAAAGQRKREDLRHDRSVRAAAI